MKFRMVKVCKDAVLEKRQVGMMTIYNAHLTTIIDFLNFIELTERKLELVNFVSQFNPLHPIQPL